MTDMPYVAGGCTLSGEKLFDVLRAFPGDHPLAGKAISVGEPHDNAMRCHFVMTDGSLMQVTLSEESLEKIRADSSLLAVLHRKIMEGLAWEIVPENRELIGATKHTDETAQRTRQSVLKIGTVRPLGIYTVERWRDVWEKENRNGA